MAIQHFEESLKTRGSLSTKKTRITQLVETLWKRNGEGDRERSWSIEKELADAAASAREETREASVKRLKTSRPAEETALRAVCDPVVGAWQTAAGE